MPKSPFTSITASLKHAEKVFQNDWACRAPAGQPRSPAADEMAIAAVRLQELFQAIQTEGAIRAIDAGGKAADWRAHLTPGLRLAYNAAGGPAHIIAADSTARRAMH